MDIDRESVEAILHMIFFHPRHVGDNWFPRLLHSIIVYLKLNLDLSITICIFHKITLKILQGITKLFYEDTRTLKNRFHLNT